MKKWILIGAGIFLLVVMLSAAIFLPMVARWKRAALRVVAENEARELQWMEEMEMPLPEEMEMEMASGSSEDPPLETVPAVDGVGQKDQLPGNSTLSRPWKIDVDILQSALYDGRYSTFSKGHLQVDDNDHLWMPLAIFFPGEETTTDAWSPLAREIMLFSRDSGRSWEITERASPAAVSNHDA